MSPAGGRSWSGLHTEKVHGGFRHNLSLPFTEVLLLLDLTTDRTLDANSGLWRDGCCTLYARRPPQSPPQMLINVAFDSFKKVAV